MRQILIILTAAFFFSACSSDQDRPAKQDDELQDITLDTQQIQAPVPDTITNTVIDTVLIRDTVVKQAKGGGLNDTNFIKGRLERKSSGAVAVLSTVRMAVQKGYDRVVFEFKDSLPGYRTEYIDKPARQCGSGEQVFLPGDGWLQIQFTPARGHTEQGQPTFPKNFVWANLKNIKKIEKTCDFEAELTWVIAVLSPKQYRVLRLSNPPRIAVDILH